MTPANAEALRVEIDALAEQICDTCLEGGHEAIETWIDHGKVYDLISAALTEKDKALGVARSWAEGMAAKADEKAAEIERLRAELNCRQLDANQMNVAWAELVDDRNTLRAELAKARKEVERLHIERDEMGKDNADLLAGVSRLRDSTRKVVKKYGRHENGCGALPFTDDDGCPWEGEECTCGFAAYLKESGQADGS
jgi:hypothetical protein